MGRSPPMTRAFMRVSRWVWVEGITDGCCEQPWEGWLACNDEGLGMGARFTHRSSYNDRVLIAFAIQGSVFAMVVLRNTLLAFSSNRRSTGIGIMYLVHAYTHIHAYVSTNTYYSDAFTYCNSHTYTHADASGPATSGACSCKSYGCGSYADTYTYTHADASGPATSGACSCKSYGSGPHADTSAAANPNCRYYFLCSIRLHPCRWRVFAESHGFGVCTLLRLGGIGGGNRRRPGRTFRSC